MQCRRCSNALPRCFLNSCTIPNAATATSTGLAHATHDGVARPRLDSTFDAGRRSLACRWYSGSSSDGSLDARRLPAVHAQVLKKIAWFVVLAPAGPDQVTLLNSTAADRKLAELPLYKELLSNFLTKEVPKRLELLPSLNRAVMPSIGEIYGWGQAGVNFH